MAYLFRIVLTLAALLLGPSIEARAADPWTKGQAAKAVVAGTLTLLDWGQTRYIAARPDEYHEKLNWVLDDHPEKEEVDAYFAGVFVVGGLVLHHVPSKWRDRLLNVTIIVEGGMVGRNYKLGIKVDL